jgi:hypothetical protein
MKLLILCITLLIYQPLVTYATTSAEKLEFQQTLTEIKERQEYLDNLKQSVMIMIVGGYLFNVVKNKIVKK